MKRALFISQFTVALFVSLSSGAARVDADILDPNFQETTFASSFDSGAATSMAWAPDSSGRLFILRGSGMIEVIRRKAATNTGVRDPNPWAVVAPVSTQVYQTLLGICFDPNFLVNRYVYVFATVSGEEQQIIRYTDDPLAKVGKNKRILVKGLPASIKHNGGALTIGSDGRLYFGVSDLALQGDGPQQLTSILGKIGRVNRFTGAPENDNPFFDGSGPNNDYIWAKGFRNPSSMVTDPVEGKVWVNSSSGNYEKTFPVDRGRNAGWPWVASSETGEPLHAALSYPNGNQPSFRMPAEGASRNGGVATFTTTLPHGFYPGMEISIYLVSDPTFNGDYLVEERLDDHHFTVFQTGADAISGSGFIHPQVRGGEIRGSCFYDSTAAPAEYHGNFFTVDYHQQFIRGIRSLDRPEIPQITTFAMNSLQHTDSAVGPDGGIYVCDVYGKVRRYAPVVTGQNVVVQPTMVSVPEGGRARFLVSLAQEPANTVEVTVTKLEGDPHLILVSPARLKFTRANWNRPLPVVIAGRQDPDFENGTATFRVSAPDLPSYDIRATEMDNERSTLILSQARLVVTEGASAAFSVRLSHPPAAATTVQVSNASETAGLAITAGQTLRFTPANYARPQKVTIAAAEDDNTTSEAARFAITRAGEPARTLDVQTNDNDPAPPVFTSLPILEAYAQDGYTYHATAVGNPSEITYSLEAAPSLNGIIGINPASGLLGWWGSTGEGTHTISIRATNSAGSATQTFTLRLRY